LRFQGCEPTLMLRAGQPTPDGHSRPFQTGAHLDLVFVPETQQGGMTILQSQFPRHGGDGEQRGQTFYPLPPIKMSRGGHADELITGHLPKSIHAHHRNTQSRRRSFGRKPRWQLPHLFEPALRALDGAVDLGDFISCPLKMHRRPAHSQHPRDLGVGFVQVPADDIKPLNGQGALPLESRFGSHRPAVIYRNFCREFKHYSIALAALWTAATCRRFESADVSAHSKVVASGFSRRQRMILPLLAGEGRGEDGHLI
jgi:hypothetical protein